ncbi:hypothetical protein DGWBC_0278 [Dehalogenimonas sp. WBC-2]|nr:hypothetical protein DGWBC_0278 [Dehalogenimonas sp. WBC-2]
MPATGGTEKEAMGLDKPQNINFLNGSGRSGDSLVEFFDEFPIVGGENHFVLPPQGYKTVLNDVYCASDIPKFGLLRKAKYAA